MKHSKNEKMRRHQDYIKPIQTQQLIDDSYQFIYLSSIINQAIKH